MDKGTYPLFQLPLRKKTPSLTQPEDFASFFEQAHLSVFRYVMVLCAGDQVEAEDVTAEAFFRAWEKRGQFSGSPAAALGWVITIARNILIDQRRAERGHPSDDLLDEALEEPGASIETLLVDAEQVQQVLAALQNLPFTQRNILTLRYVLGWKVKDIAAHLHLAENTVSVDLRRAVAKLQAQIVFQESQARRVV